MIYSHHCYNHQWRQQMWASYMQAANDIAVAEHDQVGFSTTNTAEALHAENLDNEALGEAFALLCFEQQSRYLDLRELDCPWSIIGLEH